MITGHLVRLDEIRSVFVGNSDEAPGLTFIKFTNHENVETAFKLSADAKHALIKLLTLSGHVVVTYDGEWKAASSSAAPKEE